MNSITLSSTFWTSSARYDPDDLSFLGTFGTFDAGRLGCLSALNIDSYQKDCSSVIYLRPTSFLYYMLGVQHGRDVVPLRQ
jgi:hypothetical protein